MTSPIRVLVADDEKNLRELLVRELTRKGHAAVGVPDGHAALEALKADAADVLLPDMKMPRVRRSFSADSENSPSAFSMRRMSGI